MLRDLPLINFIRFENCENAMSCIGGRNEKQDADLPAYRAFHEDLYFGGESNAYIGIYIYKYT